MKILFSLFFIILSLYAAEGSFYYENGKKISLKPVSSPLRTLNEKSGIDYYQTQRGIVVGVSDKLLVKLQDKSQLQALLKEFNLVMLKAYNNNIFLLQTPSKNKTITIANELHQKENVLFAHPDFLKQSMKR